jgi:alpha-tubulin suppressor-like RCC1 family protein
VRRILRAAIGCAAALESFASCSLIFSTSEFDARYGVDGGRDVGSEASADRSNECDPGPPDPRFLSDAVAISLGAVHSCALRLDHSVVCWGDDSILELGSEVKDLYSATPVVVVGAGSATRVASGGFHSCLVTDGQGNVYCWGDDHEGQLGSGVTFDGGMPPVRVIEMLGNAALSGVSQIAAGIQHTCAITGAAAEGGGAVVCWGDDSHDQLGPGPDAAVRAHAHYSGVPTGATAISAGECQTCALVDAEAQCWGGADCVNAPDLLGAPGELSTTPVPYGTGAGIGPVLSVVAGELDTCVINANLIYCSGANTYGEIGDLFCSGPVSPPQPVINSHTLRPTSMGLGPFHSCILTQDGTVYCAGENNHGELGNGSIVDASTPQPLGPVVWSDGGMLASVSAIAAGGIASKGVGPPGYRPGHSCAIVRAGGCADWGTVYCWGANDYGQLGDGTRTPRPNPVAVLAPKTD